jgi:transketolase
MGGIANGIAYHGGLLPFVATFLPFSDYMRGSVRLAALSDLHVIYVWTHDSVGVGEDGPTHQPVEHYAALRAIPNLTFIRPGDPHEASAAWALAVEHGGPTAMVFTRQKLPVLAGTAERARAGVRAGGYVLAEATAAGGTVTAPELILVATGSELHLAMGARELLTAEGVRVRVVSLPSWERFGAQPAAYRDEVLPPSVKARVSIESGVSLGWDRWVDAREGAIMAIDRFGLSAPAAQIFERFGFTVENVARVARGVLEGDVRGIISPDAEHAGSTLEAIETR